MIRVDLETSEVRESKVEVFMAVLSDNKEKEDTTRDNENVSELKVSKEVLKKKIWLG